MKTTSLISLKAVIEDLIAEKKECQTRSSEIEILIQGLQKQCPHPENQIVDDGCDSHYSYDRCTICQTQFKR